MKNNTIMFIVLALLLQTCKAEYNSVYEFHFHNNSDYIIDFYGYSKWKRDSIIKSLEGTIEPGQVLKKFTLGDPTSTRRGTRVQGGDAVYCYILKFFDFADSTRLYFNKGKASERYITYSRKTLKPRNIYNPQEYRYKEVKRRVAHVHYTFTNEDYHNAPEHQNAIPVPIPRCKSSSAPAGACATKTMCWQE